MGFSFGAGVANIDKTWHFRINDLIRLALRRETSGELPTGDLGECGHFFMESLNIMLAKFADVVRLSNYPFAAQTACTRLVRRMSSISLWMTWILCGAGLFAQGVVSLPPAEPLLPTTAKECTDFSEKYQAGPIKEIEKSRSSCNALGPQVAWPQSCIEGGWSGGGSIGQACFTPTDRWCRAIADKEKKFKACMEQVKDNEFKKRIGEELFLHKEPDRPKSATDSEIDAAFKIINPEGMTKGQDPNVNKIQLQAVDATKAVAKETFAELDKAFRDASFAELDKASRNTSFPELQNATRQTDRSAAVTATGSPAPQSALWYYCMSAGENTIAFTSVFSTTVSNVNQQFELGPDRDTPSGGCSAYSSREEAESVLHEEKNRVAEWDTYLRRGHTKVITIDWRPR